MDRGRPLVDHLAELRSRLVGSLVAVALLAWPGWYLSGWLLDRLAGVTGPMVYLAPTEAFAVRIKLSLLLALGMGMPIILYHLWRFVGVALTVSERRVVLGAIPASCGLFVAGTAMGWLLIAPAGLKFLLSFGTSALHPMLSVEACLSFMLWTSFGLGGLFQLPVVIGALARWGFITAETLGQYRRHAVLVILVLSAILTPGPDIFSQLLLAFPTYILFEISVLAARFLRR